MNDTFDRPRNTFPDGLGNVTGEAALIGALLVEPTLFEPIAKEVAPEDFAEPILGDIVGIIFAEYRAGRQPTPVSIRPILEQLSGFDDLGGFGWLADVCGQPGLTIGAVDQARQIRELAIRHRLVCGLRDGIEATLDLDRPIADAIADAEACLHDVRREQTDRLIAATPYLCRDPSQIPLRPWVYGRELLRGSLTVMVAPGDVGKTATTVGMGLALATGRRLHDKDVWGGPKRVWLWSLEDSGLELVRLIEAGRKHWRIADADIDGRLFVDSALDGAELCIATEDRTGFRIVEPVVDALVEELLARQIDVLIVDPFVSSHGVSENNNSAIDAIAKKWARVAVRANCAVLIVHHSRKLNGSQVTTEDSRGASALTNAARSVIALNRMTKEEAQRWGIEGEDHRRYFRAYPDKGNRRPPADRSDWYRLASVDLGNGTDDRPGDSIQVVIPWTPPDAFTGVTADHLRRVQAAVMAGDYRKDQQSPDWVGLAVADVLDLDVSDRKSADTTRVKQLLKEWLANGALIERKGKDEKRRERTFIGVGAPPDEDAPR